MLAALVMGPSVAAMPARAATLTVCATGCDHTTVQAAVDAASTGDVIEVRAGTYDENIVLSTEDVTLRGPNAGLEGPNPDRDAEAVIQPTSGTYAIELRASGVTLEGLKISGSGIPIGAADATAGLSDITIRNNVISGSSGQQAIRYWGSAGDSARRNWSITDNLIEDIRAADATAITLFDMIDLTVEGNRILHTADFNGRRGMNIDGGQGVVIRNNIVDLGLRDVLVTDNTVFTRARYSLQIASSNRAATDYSVEGNVFRGHYGAITTLGQGRTTGPLVIRGNTFQDAVFGLRTNAGCGTPPADGTFCRADSTLTGLTVTNNLIDVDWQAVRLQEGLGDGSTYTGITIVENRLYGGPYWGSSLAIIGDADSSAARVGSKFPEGIEARNNRWNGDDGAPASSDIQISAIESAWPLAEPAVAIQYEPWITDDIGQRPPPRDLVSGRGFWPLLVSEETPSDPDAPSSEATGGTGFLRAPDGAAPTVTPGSAAIVTSAGVEVTPEVRVGQGELLAGDAVRITAPGLAVESIGDRGVRADRGPVASFGGEIVSRIEADIPAGAVVEVWLFSTPRLVAAARADVAGQVDVIVPLSAPLDGRGPVEAGTHTLQLLIPTSSGTIGVNVGVTVGGPVPTSVPSGVGPSIPAAPIGMLGALGLVLAVALRRRMGAAGPA